ncbi:type II toxin-antitoxin system RatA family toxin [Natronospirillum operosum]|uniref:Type II toxin-antitoxin system RatA family toxin n=1 Tax=Natronospirillum operosum TaxID=2759953 RepID=A0A4Z0WBJ6_9GAMM|nr:type II toxin-antitoxin system RatA family toxin [Natronospirillum operosum]TGG92052.1 type II toxin-antitoxin system RatA family toxin [Natronospirillum operosum]
MKIERRAHVPYSPEQMYALVHDIRSYPEFLPEISDVRILDESADAIAAELEVHKGPVRETFATRNQLRPPGWMSMELVRGPFRHLHGEWHFVAGETGSEVCFQLDFEVKGFGLRMILEPVVGKMADRLVDRFAQRARQIYG